MPLPLLQLNDNLIIPTIFVWVDSNHSDVRACEIPALFFFLLHFMRKTLGLRKCVFPKRQESVHFREAIHQIFFRPLFEKMEIYCELAGKHEPVTVDLDKTHTLHLQEQNINDYSDRWLYKGKCWGFFDGQDKD